MNIRDQALNQPLERLSGRSPQSEAKKTTENGLHPDFIVDVFSGAVPTFGLFAHAENMESLVSYPQGNPVYVQKGRANVETCQSGFGANLMGTVALAGAGLLSGFGLASVALPVASVGVASLLISGVTNAFVRREIESASG